MEDLKKFARHMRLAAEALEKYIDDNIKTTTQDVAVTVSKTEKQEVNIFDDMVGSVKLSTQEQWVKIYDDEAWIQSEISKAKAWILENSHKAPKSRFGRFYNNWLARGWEQHRRSLEGRSQWKSYNERMVESYQQMFKSGV